jgi:hypothetical protein
MSAVLVQVEIRKRSERRPPFPRQACGIRRLQRHNTEHRSAPGACPLTKDADHADGDGRSQMVVVSSFMRAKTSSFKLNCAYFLSHLAPKKATMSALVHSAVPVTVESANTPGAISTPL